VEDRKEKERILAEKISKGRTGEGKECQGEAGGRKEDGKRG